MDAARVVQYSFQPRPTSPFRKLFASAATGRASRLAGAVVLPLIVLVAVQIVLRQARAAPGTVINFVPYTVTSPGTYYLDSDLNYEQLTNSAAITVQASGVVIDLKGHKLGGARNPASRAVGIAANQQSNITIQNGTIQGFQFGIQISGPNRHGNQVRNVVLTGNSYIGLWVEGAETVVANNRVENTGGCNISGATTAVAIHVAGRNSTVVDNRVSGFVWRPGVTHEVVALGLDAAPGALVTHNVFLQASYARNSWGVWANSIANDYSTTVALENNYFENLEYGSAFIYSYGHMTNNTYCQVTTKWLVPDTNSNTDLGGNATYSSASPDPDHSTRARDDSNPIN